MSLLNALPPVLYIYAWFGEGDKLVVPLVLDLKEPCLFILLWLVWVGIRIIWDLWVKLPLLRLEAIFWLLSMSSLLLNSLTWILFMFAESIEASFLSTSSKSNILLKRSVFGCSISVAITLSTKFSSLKRESISANLSNQRAFAALFLVLGSLVSSVCLYSSRPCSSTSNFSKSALFPKSKHCVVDNVPLKSVRRVRPVLKCLRSN